jgi:hypothetical protein
LCAGSPDSKADNNSDPNIQAGLYDIYIDHQQDTTEYKQTKHIFSDIYKDIQFDEKSRRQKIC